MTAEQLAGFIIALLIMIVGLAGNVLPGIPGAPLVLAGAILHRLYFGQVSISNLVLVILVLITAAAVALDYLATAIGAKRFGATWRGAVGAAVGGLIGLFFSIPGIILGPFIGATLFEMGGGQQFKPATKAGAGAMVGLLIGTVGKLSLSATMIGLFVINVLLRTVK
jgi:uncharacterized protein YqgC (DUF456 family)